MTSNERAKMRIFSCALCIAISLAGNGWGGEIDDFLATAHRKAGVKAAPVCSDDEFLRRISLDLMGRIPTRQELVDFRQRPDRRAKIEELLASEDFPRFWAEVWTASLVGYRTRAFNVSREPLRKWLEESFADDVGYDEIAGELIAAEGESAFDGPVNFVVRHREQPAVKVSRFFLGVQLDCARCHDHPFDRWTSEDFEKFNQFFRSATYSPVSQRNIRVIETPRNVREEDKPRFLTGAEPTTNRWRDELAFFVTTCKPFARNYANRVWYQLLGRGIVDPPDSFVDGAAVAPELLEFFAQQTRDDDFELRPLVRMICQSDAYQRESGHSNLSEQANALFASYVPKPMTTVQLLNSLETATGIRLSSTERGRRLARTLQSSIDDDFSQTWNYRDTVQNVMQRLVEEHEFRDSSIHALYEKILSRSPTPSELSLCRGRNKSQIVFALINSNEFRFNH